MGVWPWANPQTSRASKFNRRVFRDGRDYKVYCSLNLSTLSYADSNRDPEVVVGDVEGGNGTEEEEMLSHNENESVVSERCRPPRYNFHFICWLKLRTRFIEHVREIDDLVEEARRSVAMTEQTNPAPGESGEIGGYFIEYNLIDEKVSGSLFQRSISTEYATVEYVIQYFWSGESYFWWRSNHGCAKKWIVYSSNGGGRCNPVSMLNV